MCTPNPRRPQCGKNDNTPGLPGLTLTPTFTPEQLARRDARVKRLVAVFAAARLKGGWS